ncbi:hypothetical protein QUF64_05675 [Anaerolineales bacterium HSG6]|nr:hypothetical protein [Anaerolineales bacterium HSG6]MDM8533054.1 hypothetical protein [Anaerolineales bacterium HSG25]
MVTEMLRFLHPPRGLVNKLVELKKANCVVVNTMLKMARWLPANMSAGSQRAVNRLLFNIKLTITKKANW